MLIQENLLKLRKNNNTMWYLTKNCSLSPSLPHLSSVRLKLHSRLALPRTQGYHSENHLLRRGRILAFLILPKATRC